MGAVYVTADLRPFFRLQSNDYLEALRDKIAADLLSNVQTTSVSLNGKTGSQMVHVGIADLASQLADVLQERGLIPSGSVATPRMTLARFV